VDVRFAFTGHQSKPLDIVAVLTDDTDRSNVLRGENNGRLLQHVSVARSLTRVAKVKDDGEESIHVPLPDGFQPGGGSGHHLILFAQGRCREQSLAPPRCLTEFTGWSVTNRWFKPQTCGREREPRHQFPASYSGSNSTSRHTAWTNRKKELFMKTTTVSNLALAAAFAGLLGGTTARLNAQPISGQSQATASSSAVAGVMVASEKELPKHSCKGQNDCKGQGGGDKAHRGKNSCKGQGACATDGSTPPKS
jgi:hypothetical protein